MTVSPAPLRVLAPALFAAVVASLSACDRAAPDAPSSGPAPGGQAAAVAPSAAPGAVTGTPPAEASAPVGPVAVTPEPSAATASPAAPSSATLPPSTSAPRPTSPATPPVAQPAAVAVPAAFAGCSGCHSVAQGAPHKIGPNLFGVVGAHAGSRPGYAYSDAMSEAEITWTRDNLDQFLQGPRDMVPGTKMAAPPVRDPETRRSLIAYLETLR